MSDEQKGSNITERVTIAGADLVDYVKGLIQEGNIRRLIIRKPDGDVLLEVPLTAGIAVSGAIALMAPVFAALGAMAALVAKVQVDIVRNDDSEDAEDDST
jgi:hypothetical protein